MSPIKTLEAGHPQAVWRMVCEFVGVLSCDGQNASTRFLVRCEQKAAEEVTKCLREALGDDYQIPVFGQDVKTPWADLGHGWVGVQEGRVPPGPFKKKDLREAIGAATAITVVFESYEEGELISSTWAAFPEGMKTAGGPFRAAVGKGEDRTRPAGA